MKKAIKEYLVKHGFGQLAPKAVLFDMDGVLLDSMSNHAKAWVEAMATYGIDMTEADAYATEGQRGIDTIRYMVKEQQGRDLSMAEAQAMYDTKAQAYSKLPEAEIMPGVKELMKRMKKDGMKIIVVTGSGQLPLIERLTRDFHGYVTKENIITAYDVKHGKPDPEPYLIGLEKAGNLQPWEAIVVENAPLGVRAGNAAEIFTVAVNTGPLPDSALSDEGADIVFPDMDTFSKAWKRSFHVTYPQDEMWENGYNAIMHYMMTNKRRPSKHHAEDMQMVNWIKYNKKNFARGKMTAERAEKFQILLDTAKRFRRLNQYTYLNSGMEEELFKEKE